MDLRKLKTLIELVESSGIAELEISEGEERVRITRTAASAQQAYAPAQQHVIAAAAFAPQPARAGSRTRQTRGGGRSRGEIADGRHVSTDPPRRVPRHSWMWANP